MQWCRVTVNSYSREGPTLVIACGQETISCSALIRKLAPDCVSLVLISADSVQRPSWALDSAPWSGEPNPIGLWALSRRRYIEEVGAQRHARARESSPLLPTDRLRWCRKRREARCPQATSIAATAARRRRHQHWYCTSSSTWTTPAARPRLRRRRSGLRHHARHRPWTVSSSRTSE